MSVLMPSPVFRWFVFAGSNLVPAAGYKVNFFAGGTSISPGNAKTIYTDTFNTPYPSPSNQAVLDSEGKAQIYLGSGLYLMQITDPLGSQVYTEDYIQGGGNFGTGFVDVVNNLSGSYPNNLPACDTNANRYTWVAGYYAPGDGGNGFFMNQTSGQADDGGYCIASTFDTNKKWFLIPNEIGIVNAAAFGCIPSNTVNRTSNLIAADAYALTQGAQLVIATNVDSDLTEEDTDIILNGTVTLTSGVQIIRGNPRFTSNGGSATLKFNRLVCEAIHIFQTDITIKFILPNQVIYLEWFNAAGDGTTDDSAALVAAAAAIGYNGIIKLLAPHYALLTSSISLNNAAIKIMSDNGSGILSGFIINSVDVYWSNLSSGITLENISIEVTGKSFYLTSVASGSNPLTNVPACNFNAVTFFANTLADGITAFHFDCPIGNFDADCRWIGTGVASPTTNVLAYFASSNPNQINLQSCQFYAVNISSADSIAYGFVSYGSGVIVNDVGCNYSGFLIANRSATSGSVINVFVYAANGVIPGPIEIGSYIKIDGYIEAKAGSGSQNFKASGQIFSIIGSAATSGTGETALLSATLKANTLVNDSDRIRITLGGTIGGTSNGEDRRIRLTIGGTTFFDVTMTNLGLGSIGNFRVDIDLWKNGTDIWLATGIFYTDAKATASSVEINGTALPYYAAGTLASVFEADQTIQCYGTAVSGGTGITQKILAGEFIPAPI